MKKIAISVSEESLEAVDREAAALGISRSAWFERAVARARRHAALERALAEAIESGIRPSTDGELEALRRELGLLA